MATIQFMSINKMKPFLKWAGGKRQLLPYIQEYINKVSLKGKTYFEPFLGGGSVFFNIGYKKCIVNDLNEELINCYKIVRDNPEELISALKKHKKNHNKDYFYKIRSLDRDEKVYKKLTNIEKAARTIYLNKTCFNGLYRVNKKGQFNTPIGRYADPLVCDEETIRDASKYLKNEGIKFLSCDFVESVSEAKKGDWIYFDPPYDYEDTGFVGYSKEGFSHDDLLRLRQLCDNLIEKGCNVLISNNDTKFVRKTFEADKYEIIYSTKIIKANRNINSKGSRRAKVDEVLIYGRKAK